MYYASLIEYRTERGKNMEDPVKMLRKSAVLEMSGLSPAGLYREMERGTFPRPLTIGARSVAWSSADLVQWQQGLQTSTIKTRNFGAKR